MRKPSFVYTLVIVAIFSFENILAQAPPPGVPIDGGILFLLASGLVLGVGSFVKKKE